MTESGPMATDASTEASQHDRASLEARFGVVVGGAALWRLLGFRTGDAFRKAAQRQALPVATFTLPNRRGRFARTADIAAWLATLVQPAAAEKEHL